MQAEVPEVKLSLCSGVICLLLLIAPGGSQAVERLVTPSSDGTIYSPSRTFSINYTPETVEGFDVELWYVLGDETRWRYYRADEDGKTPISFAAERDGVYFFHIRAATDSSARSQPSSFEPQMKIVIDTEPPSVGILSPSEKQLFQRGETIPLTWKVTDRNPVDNALDIYYITPTDQDWRLAADGLGMEGGFAWQPPATALGNVRLRIRAIDKASNWGEDTVDLSIDRLPQDSSERINIPEASSSREVRINFQLARDVPSGNAEVELWVTDDGGENWYKYGIFSADEGHVTFLAPSDGIYGFHLVGVGKSGITETRPAPGTKAEFECIVDTKPPEVFLLSPVGGESWRGKERQKIVWKASDENLPLRPISLYYSTDGGTSWKALALRLENSSEHMWEVPWIAGDKFLVKVRVKDLAGNVSEATSRGFFAVDTSPPSVEATGVEGAARPWPQIGDKSIRPATDSVAPTGIVLEGSGEKSGEQKSLSALVQEAVELWAKGHLGDAEHLLWEAHKRFPQHVELTNNLGAILIAVRKYDKAIEVLRSALDAGDSSVTYNLGIAYERSGDLYSALEEFRVALELDPESAEIKWALAETLFALGRREDAQRMWEELSQDEKLPEAWRRKAGELSKSGSR